MVHKQNHRRKGGNKMQITLNQLAEILDSPPEWLRKKFSNPELSMRPVKAGGKNVYDANSLMTYLKNERIKKFRDVTQAQIKYNKLLSEVADLDSAKGRLEEML